MIKQSNLIIACIEAPTDKYPAYILKLQRACAIADQTADAAIFDNKDTIKVQRTPSAIAEQTAGATISDNKDTVKVQLVYADETVDVGGKVVPNGDTYTIIELELPDTQPLAWKKSNVSSRKWSTLDEILHRPDAKQYLLQRQQWDLFHDDRRKALVRDFSKLIFDGRETHIESHGDFSLYAFTNTRPERCWTVGGEGSERLGFAKDQMSSLGGCMYTLDEADVLCFTEAEHAAWAKHNVANKPIKIIDEGFNNRRPAQSMEGFIKMIERRSAANDVLIDVQKLNMPLNEYAGVQMHMQEAIKLIKSGLNGKPVSNENAPINLLNIHNAKRGNWPEGMVKEYTMLDDLVNICQAKLYEDMNDMEGQYSIGKSNMAVKHHSDITNCGQFNLLALPGAVSQWHQDANGVHTYALAEKRTDDPNEAPDAVVKYWPSFPMYHLAPEDQKNALAQYAKDGTNWRPKPAGGIPLIALVPGMFMIQQPGNIHAPITLTACFMAGGMAWKENGFRESLKVMRFLAENNHCTNEEVPRQVQEILRLLANEIEADPTKYGFASDSAEDLKEFYASLKIIHSAVPDAYCQCRGPCVKGKCQCMMLNLRCGTRCHPKKVFDHRKPCSAWKDDGASAPRKESIRHNNRKVLEDLFEDSVDERISIKSNGKRSRSLADSSGADDKRQHREDSQSSAPETKQKKMSAREIEREGKPCHKCGRSGMRTFSRGPTGNTLCSACNKKWMKQEQPAAADWLPYAILPTPAAEEPSASMAPAAPTPSTAPAASTTPATASGPRRQSLEFPGSFSPRPAPPSVLSPHTTGSNGNALNKSATNPFRQKGMNSPGQGIASPIASPTSSMAPTATKKVVKDRAEVPTSSIKSTESEKKATRNPGEGRAVPTSRIASANKKGEDIGRQAQAPTLTTSNMAPTPGHKQTVTKPDEVPDGDTIVVEEPSPPLAPARKKYLKKPVSHCGVCETTEAGALGWKFKELGTMFNGLRKSVCTPCFQNSREWCLEELARRAPAQAPPPVAVAPLPTSTTSDEPRVAPGMHKRKRSDDSDEAYGSQSPKRTQITESLSPPVNEEIVVLPTSLALHPSPPPREASPAPVPVLSAPSRAPSPAPRMASPAPFVASPANIFQIKPSTSTPATPVAGGFKPTIPLKPAEGNDAFAKASAAAKKKACRDEMEKAKDEDWDSEGSVDEGEWEKHYWKKKEKEEKQFEEKIKNPTLKVPSFGSLALHVPSAAAPAHSAAVPVLSPASQPEAEPKMTLKLGPNAEKSLSGAPSADVDEDIMAMDEDGDGDARMRDAPLVAPVKKTVAKGAAKKPNTARPAAEDKLRVTKPKAGSPTKSTAADPVRKTRHTPSAKLEDHVELDVCDCTGKAKAAPKGKKISDATAKGEKRVEVKQEGKEENPLSEVPADFDSGI